VVPSCRIVEQLNLQPLVSKVESGSSVLSRVDQLKRSKEAKWPQEMVPLSQVYLRTYTLIKN
jgi:hypothetical protein